MNRLSTTHAAVLTAAAALFAAGILADGHIDRSDLRAAAIGIGVAVVVVAVGSYNRHALRQRIRPLDDMFEKGIEIGRNSGYWDGRRSVRPVVVHMNCPNCGEPMRKTG